MKNHHFSSMLFSLFLSCFMYLPLSRLQAKTTITWVASGCALVPHFFAWALPTHARKEKTQRTTRKLNKESPHPNRMG